MKKVEGIIDYAEYKEEHKEELLKSALAAIDPDTMGMNRDQAMTLMGAMKACGFTRTEFAEVMARSIYDKGTFAKHWGAVRGSGKNGTCTEGTIFEYAQQCGWKWPRPEEDGIPQKKKIQDPGPEFMKKWGNDFKIEAIIDEKQYTGKPSKAGEIRNREQSPTPAPAPISLQDFASAITKGQTFSPTVYNKIQIGTKEDGKPQYEYIPISQQLFVVDIDNDEPATDEAGRPIKGQKRRIENPLTIDDALEICKKNGIKPTFYYETFSSKDHREDPAEPYTKFRLVFVTDKPITIRENGERGLKQIINYFVSLFGKAADTSTTDFARLIYGTDEKDRAHLTGYIIDSNKLMQRIYSPKPADTEKQATPEYIKQLQTYYENLIKAWKTDAPVFENGDRQPFIDYITEDEKLDDLDALLVKLGIDRETHDNIAHTLNEAAASGAYGTEAPAFSELFKDLKYTAPDQSAQEGPQDDSTEQPNEPTLEELKEIYNQKTAAAHIHDFFANIEEEASKPALLTGFPSLDNILGGGIRTGLYVIGALSSLGKTTFMIQVADYIAKQGRDVLYFTLEQPEREIMAKSISRETYNAALMLTGDTKQAKSTMGILNGRRYKNYTQEEKQTIKQATAQYMEYADKIHIIEGVGNIGVTQIEQCIKDHEKITGNTPVVFIDYLQIMAPPIDNRRSYTDKQATDKNILELKRLSRTYAIIAISSFNRDSYTEPVNLASFKESGAIEYTSDYLIGLQYAGMDYRIERDGKRESEAKHAARVQKEVFEIQQDRGKKGQSQNIELKLLKGRIVTKDKINLLFYPCFNLYQEEGTEQGTPQPDARGFTYTPAEKTPFYIV